MDSATLAVIKEAVGEAVKEQVGKAMREHIGDVGEAIETAVCAALEKNNPKHLPFLEVKDLIARWGCGKNKAYEFMHRRGSEARKVGKKLLVSIREVERYERQHPVRTG